MGGGANSTSASQHWADDNPCFTLGAVIAWICGSIATLCLGSFCFFLCNTLKRHGNGPAQLMQSFTVMTVVAKPMSVLSNNELPLEERLRRKAGYICVGGCCVLFAGILVLVILALDPSKLFDSSAM